MILDPRAVLNELIKYQKIINISRTAFDRLSKAQPVDDLRDILNIKLNECSFTQYSGTTESKTPLYSVSSYIDKSETLSHQIEQAEGFVQKVIKKIEAEVGPFLTKKEVLNMREIKDITLQNQVWGPTFEEIHVKQYFDINTKISVQADWAHGQYRTASDGAEFGPWKLFIN